MSDLEAIGGVEGGFGGTSSPSEPALRPVERPPDQSVKPRDARGLALAIADRMNRLFGEVEPASRTRASSPWTELPRRSGWPLEWLPPWFSASALILTARRPAHRGERGLASGQLRPEGVQVALRTASTCGSPTAASPRP